MSRAVPLGKTESETLEFKSRDSRPIDIAREVVAFLNAGGGKIWWGVKEAGGRAESTEPLDNTDCEARKRDLQNHLIDTLEPSPSIPGEVRIDSEPDDQAGFVICIQVKKSVPGRAPVAQLKDQGRRYWIRVGDRVRIMSREEIRKQFSQATDEGEVIEKQLLAAREQALRAANKDHEARFWMKIQPVPEFDHQRFDIGDKALEVLLMDPAATGSRRNGWNFIRELTRPRIGASGLKRSDKMDEIEIQRTGAIVFSTALDRLHWNGAAHEIWPYALLEYPVSVMRLAAKVGGTWGGEVSHLLVDFAFAGLRDWTLRGGSPRLPSGRYHHLQPFKEDNLEPIKPFKFNKEDLVTEPDRCTLSLITFVYEAFGYEKEAIPPEFDQKTGTLIIPD